MNLTSSGTPAMTLSMCVIHFRTLLVLPVKLAPHTITEPGQNNLGSKLSTSIFQHTMKQKMQQTKAEGGKCGRKAETKDVVAPNADQAS